MGAGPCVAESLIAPAVARMTHTARSDTRAEWPSGSPLRWPCKYSARISAGSGRSLEPGALDLDHDPVTLQKRVVVRVQVDGVFGHLVSDNRLGLLEAGAE